MSGKRKLSEGEDGDGGAKLQKVQLSETSIKVEPVRPGLPLPVFTTPVPKKTSEEGGPDGPGSSSCIAQSLAPTTTTTTSSSPRQQLAPATRISRRAVKKQRGGSGGGCGGKQSADDAISEAEETNNCKRRRTWELWGPNEKHIFFEALNEYGKDFDKIQSHFQAKLKNKRNMPAHYIKNKNQIRHFYYRTWHKIAGHIHFTSELTKNSRELIGLINYGELWKKIGGTVDEKFGQKLDDLVQNGTAALKVKGKSQRVKTPVCRALKKVYGKADSVEKTVGKAKLPSKVRTSLFSSQKRILLLKVFISGGDRAVSTINLGLVPCPKTRTGGPQNSSPHFIHNYFAEPAREDHAGNLAKAPDLDPMSGEEVAQC